MNTFGGGFGSPYGIGWGEIQRGLVSNSILAVNNASHSHTVVNITITQQHVLSVNAAVNSTTSDNISVTQAHFILVDNSTNSILSDVINVIHNIPLNKPDDSSHSIVSGVIGLTQDYHILVDAALHATKSYNLINIIVLDDLNYFFGRLRPTGGSSGALDATELDDDKRLRPTDNDGGVLTPSTIDTGILKPNNNQTGILK